MSMVEAVTTAAGLLSGAAVALAHRRRRAVPTRTAALLAAQSPRGQPDDRLGRLRRRVTAAAGAAVGALLPSLAAAEALADALALTPRTTTATRRRGTTMMTTALVGTAGQAAAPRRPTWAS
jgi:hypothetical protein